MSELLANVLVRLARERFAADFQRGRLAAANQNLAR